MVLIRLFLLEDGEPTEGRRSREDVLQSCQKLADWVVR